LNDAVSELQQIAWLQIRDAKSWLGPMELSIGGILAAGGKHRSGSVAFLERFWSAQKESPHLAG
jgi:hypothetical protein